jgi:hypothetical protein
LKVPANEDIVCYIARFDPSIEGLFYSSAALVTVLKNRIDHQVQQEEEDISYRACKNKMRPSMKAMTI